jgi:hypothetical protein
MLETLRSSLLSRYTCELNPYHSVADNNEAIIFAVYVWYQV